MTDKQRLDQFRLQVRNYPQWDVARYQNAVSGAFDRLVTNNNDYMSAIYDAASQNKPVVMMIGKGSDPASRQVIENSLKDAHRRNGKDAVYVFVDMDRVDKNSAIGKYANENMPRKGQEPPFTMVFSISKGDAGNPVKADGPSYYHMGPVDSMGIDEAVSRLKLQMVGRFNMPRPQDNPQPGPNPDAPVNPGTVDTRTQEAFALALMQAQRQTDKQTAYNSYKQAVDIADNAKNPAMQAAARVELGLACIKWGFAETGFKWILEAGGKNPAIYDSRRNQPFVDRMKQAGIPQPAVDALIEQGKRNPTWYLNDRDCGKKLEAAMLSKPPSPSVVPTRYDQPQPIHHRRPSPFK